MTAKERAKELCMKFDKKGKTDNAKQCALIAVDEILNIESFHLLNSTLKNDIDYWREVKQEIEKL